MSAFAAWLIDRLAEDPQAAEVNRAFAAVEHVASAEQFPMGRALVTEFVEAISHEPDAVQRLGSATRLYMRST